MEVLFSIGPQLFALLKQAQRLPIGSNLKLTYPLRCVIDHVQVDPLGVQQVINLFIVDLHVGNVS